MIKTNTQYSEGFKVQIKGKYYPLIKTSSKSVYYLNKKNQQKRTAIENVEKVFEPPKKKEKGNHNFGGHMSNPPEDCNHPKIFEYEGVKWIDNQICNSHCKVKNCQRFKEYKKELKKLFK